MCNLGFLTFFYEYERLLDIPELQDVILLNVKAFEEVYVSSVLYSGSLDV